MSGIGVDSRGDVLVFHRAGRNWTNPNELDTRAINEPTVLRFDGASGALLGEWGAGLFAIPHGLEIAPDDTVWLTDVALQQVYRFSADGRLLMRLGERGVAGRDHAHFDRPTGVAVTRDGSFYVSDGYGNTRVVKFAPDGKYLFEWGGRGSAPGEFDLPHGIALDSRGRVYVADRGNARLQAFDSGGRFLKEWKGAHLGRPYDVAIAPDGNLVVVGISDPSISGAGPFSGSVLRYDGTILGRFHPSEEELSVTPHGCAVGWDGSIYVAGVARKRVLKFVKTG